LQFCKLLKSPLSGIYAIHKNGQIIAILQIAIYKNGQINEIWQIIKIPLLQIYKNGQNATKYIILHLRVGSFRPI
jgi:hypothetical protein